jgi:hypothetical protein
MAVGRPQKLLSRERIGEKPEAATSVLRLFAGGHLP